MTVTHNRIWALPAAVIGGSFLLRFIHLLSMPGNPRTYHPGADEEFYIRFGMDVAHGAFGLTPEFLFMDPLYGYFLGLLFTLFGKNLFLVYLFQVVLDTVTVGLVYLIGKELSGRQVGLLAALFYGIAATALFYSTTILKPSFSAFYVTLWVYIGLRLWVSGTLWGWLGYGLFLGLGVALRSNLLLMALAGLIIVPLGNHFCRHTNSGNYTIHCMLILLGLALVLTTLAWRNVLISNHWSFLPPNGGVVLHQIYNADNPEARHDAPVFVNSLHPSEILRDYQQEAERRLERPLLPYEVSAYWRTEATHYIEKNLTQTLHNIMRKIGEFTTYKEIANNRALSEGEYFSNLLSVLPRPFGLLLMFGVPGLLLITLRTPKGWLLLTTLLTIGATFAFFFAISRLRFPLVPVLAIGAALTLNTLLYQRETKRRDNAIVIVGIVLLGGLSFWNSTRLQEPAVDEFMLGLGWGYLKMGDLKSAQALSQTLLQQEPENHRVYELAGFLSLQQKKPMEAAGYYENALRIEPENHVHLFNYAISLEQSGRFDLAIDTIDRAVQFSALPSYLYRRALILESLGRSGESLALLKKLAHSETADESVEWRTVSKLAATRLMGSMVR
ncbi:MAG: glycosyltransferase family 39 protein [Sedimenticola sp.]